MTNSEQARYFLKGEMPKVETYYGIPMNNIKGIAVIEFLYIDDSELGRHVADNCTTHLHHPDKWRKVIPQGHKCWIELAEKYGGDPLDWYNSFSAEIHYKSHLRASWVDSVYFENNLFKGDLNNVPQNVKLI